MNALPFAAPVLLARPPAGWFNTPMESDLVGAMGYSLGEVLWTRDSVPVQGQGFANGRAAWWLVRPRAAKSTHVNLRRKTAVPRSTEVATVILPECKQLNHRRFADISLETTCNNSAPRSRALPCAC
jgi:hypothetical protein